jgi:hypothetical protein
MTSVLFWLCAAQDPSASAAEAEELFRSLREASIKGEPEVRVRASEVLVRLERAAALRLPAGASAILFDRRAFTGSLRDAVEALSRDSKVEIALSDDAAWSSIAGIVVQHEAQTNTSLAGSLDEVCQKGRLRWVARGGGVVIEPKPMPAGDKVKMAVYDVRDMVCRRDNLPGQIPTLRRFAEVGGPRVTFTLEEPEEPILSTDDLVTLIMEEVDPDVWSDEAGTAIEVGPYNQLFVKAPASTQDKIAGYLKNLRQFGMVRCGVRFWVFVLNPTESAQLPDSVTSDDWEKFRARMAESRPDALLSAARFSSFSRQRVSPSAMTTHRLVVSYSTEGQPETQAVLEGTSFDVRSVAEEGSTVIEARIGISKLLGIEKVKTARGDIQLPHVAEAMIQATRRVENGKPTILARHGGFAGANTLLVVAIWDRSAE